MAISRFEPFNLLNQLQREFNQLFGTGRFGDEDTSHFTTSDWAPAVDIKEEGKVYIIQADLPGVEPKDIEITLEKGVLTLKGQRASETKEETEKYRRVERVRGTFLRRFSLPNTVETEKVSAKYTNGVLEVTVPKGAADQPRKITVEG